MTWTKGHGVLQAIPTVFVRQTKSLFVFVNYVAVRVTVLDMELNEHLRGTLSSTLYFSILTETCVLANNIWDGFYCSS